MQTPSASHAQEVGGGWYRSGDAPSDTDRPPSSSRNKLGELEPSSEAAFAKWKVGLENRMVVDSEKERQKERRDFKAREDARFWTRKQDLHRKTTEGFRDTKAIVAEVHASNHEKAEMYKVELELMKETVRNQNDEWAQFGHELALEFGTEQAERTKQSAVESVKEKARKGEEVRQEEKRWLDKLATQRGEQLEEARQHVLNQKADAARHSGVATAYALQQRQAKVGSVKRTEREWKDLTSKEREAFLEHAQQNRDKASSTTEQMRTARKDLVKTNNSDARKERQRKEDDEQVIAKRRAENAGAKQVVHDQVCTERRISPEKLRAMKEVARAKSPKKRAQKAAAIASLPPQPPPSPYKL